MRGPATALTLWAGLTLLSLREYGLGAEEDKGHFPTSPIPASSGLTLSLQPAFGLSSQLAFQPASNFLPPPYYPTI